MKIALQNAWGSDAETEIIRRFIIAGARLGFDVYEVRTTHDIKKICPDFVIAITRETPKTTCYPTYHVANLPINHYLEFSELLDMDNRKVAKNFKTLLTYDACLTNSLTVSHWLQEVFRTFKKRCFIFTSYFSSFYLLPYFPIDFSHARLAYFGVNWDGPRFSDLFRMLDNEMNCVSFYGRRTGWQHLNFKNYQGEIPFDGQSVIDTYRHNGVGLCLHRPEFISDNMPTNRIFEITASSALAITNRMPFIEDNFGDSVLYIDQDRSISEIFSQIKSHMNWIHNNPAEAKKKALKANKIFSEKFTMEDVLKNIVDFHQTIKKEKFSKPSSQIASFFKKPDITCIYFLSKKSLTEKYKIIRMIRAAHPGSKTIFIRNNNQYHEKLLSIKTKYAIFLDNKGSIFKDHISLLIQTLEASKTAPFTYSGCVEEDLSVRYTEESRIAMDTLYGTHDIVSLQTIDSSRLCSMQAWDLKDFLDGSVQLSPCSVLFRVSALKKSFSSINFAEKDFFSILLCEVSKQGTPVFCPEVTSSDLVDQESMNKKLLKSEIPPKNTSDFLIKAQKTLLEFT